MRRLVDRTLSVTGVGDENRCEVYDRDEIGPLPVDEVLGRKFDQSFAGDSVRKLHRRLIEAALSNGGRRLFFEHRRDAPGIERRMSINPVRCGGAPARRRASSPAPDA